MATDGINREACRRQIKLLGIYLALLAWKHGKDCVGLPREELRPFLDLDERTSKKQIDRFTEDVKYLFPHAWITEVAKTKKYETLYLSRLTITEEMKNGVMDDPERVEVMAKGGLKAAIVKFPPESEIVRDLACDYAWNRGFCWEGWCLTIMDWSPRSRTSNRCSRSGGSQQSSSLSPLQSRPPCRPAPS